MMLHFYHLINTLLPSISVWEYLAIEKLLIGLVCLIGHHVIGKELMATLLKARMVLSILPAEKTPKTMIFPDAELRSSNS
jgi:hypothetical protein